MNSRFGYFDFCWCAIGMGCAMKVFIAQSWNAFFVPSFRSRKITKWMNICSGSFYSEKKARVSRTFVISRLKCFLVKPISWKVLGRFVAIFLGWKRDDTGNETEKQIFQAIKKANLILPINQSWWWLYRRTAIKVLNELTQVPGHVRIRSIARVVKSNHF